MNYEKGEMKNFNFSKTELDCTAWLENRQEAKDELSAIRSAEYKAKKELSQERKKWAKFNNYKLA